MKFNNADKQTRLAIAMSGMAQGVGEELGLSGAETIEAMVYGLAMACVDMTSPDNRTLCITEASKLLSTYATPVTVDSPLQSIATH